MDGQPHPDALVRQHHSMTLLITFVTYQYYYLAQLITLLFKGRVLDGQLHTDALVCHTLTSLFGTPPHIITLGTSIEWPASR